MTRNEFNNSKMFGGMSMLVDGKWLLVASIDFETGEHEDSEGNFYRLEMVDAYSDQTSK